MKIILYTTNCPKCRILEAKLNSKHVKYEACNDVDQMQELGIQSAPYLGVDENLLDYFNAVQWVNSKED